MNKIKILIVFFLTAFLFGCKKDFLDKKKLGSLTNESFFVQESDAFQAVVAAYSDLKDYRYTWTLWAFGDVLSDDATYSGSDADAQSYAQMEAYNYPTDNGRILGRWQILYRGINKANQAIDGISKMDDKLFKTYNKNRLLGEALFLRAYYYHELVKVFGDVILFTKTPTIADKQQKRTPVADVYKQIEEDLKTAASYLPAKSQLPVSDLGKATKGAANAMLARVYLYEKKYEECKAACLEVFKDGYELESDYGYVFTLAGEHCKESIFEINHYNSSTQSAATTNNGNFHVLMMMPFGATYGYGINQPRKSLADAFDAAGDTMRKNATLLTDADIKAWETAADYAKLERNRTGYYNQKYYIKPADRAKEIRNNPVNIRLIRLSEIYLTYAEALVKSATPDNVNAREYLNKVRRRAKLEDNTTANGDALFDAILNERRLELAMEGHRYFDMVRTGKAATAFKEKGNFKEGISNLMPIPQAEIDMSGGTLTQNPL